MSRAGRKRKPGHRYKNGNLRRVNGRSIAPADGEKIVVLSQPHRLKNQDQLCECPLGRLIIRRKLRREIFDAALEWGKFMRRWLAIKGIPTEVHIGGSTGKQPETHTVRRWDSKVAWTIKELRWVSRTGFEGLWELAVAERETGYPEPEIVEVLVELAALTRDLPRNQQPFLSSF